MAGFLFRLETVDGSPAEPSTLEAAVPVIDKRDDDADQPPCSWSRTPSLEERAAPSWRPTH